MFELEKPRLGYKDGKAIARIIIKRSEDPDGICDPRRNPDKETTGIICFWTHGFESLSDDQTPHYSDGKHLFATLLETLSEQDPGNKAMRQALESDNISLMYQALQSNENVAILLLYARGHADGRRSIGLTYDPEFADGAIYITKDRDPDAYYYNDNRWKSATEEVLFKTEINEYDLFLRKMLFDFNIDLWTGTGDAAAHLEDGDGFDSTNGFFIGYEMLDIYDPHEVYIMHKQLDEIATHLYSK